jgi:hypothetical protein
MGRWALVPLCLAVISSPGSAQGPVEPFPYPSVQGRNLEDAEFRIPAELPGDPRLLLVPFKQWQQQEVDTWLARLPALAEEVPGLRYYELPTLTTGWKVMRWMIDGGMKSGIADPAARARTITVYTDKGRFLREARIEDDAHIEVMLLDARGRVTWRARGPLTPGAWDSLRWALSPEGPGGAATGDRPGPAGS